MTNFNLYDPFAVGFDSMLKRLNDTAVSMTKAATFPPYNIKKVDDNKYIIELAVAGFSKSNIEITIEDDTLKISGKTDNSNDSINYLYKGIAERAFTRSFTLADTVEVKNADLINGMLRVWLENIIPDNKKPRKVDITDSEELQSKPELLTEQ